MNVDEIDKMNWCVSTVFSKSLKVYKQHALE